ncbi:MAG: selenium metabolism-associated LysR family transcriptional regulator [bacterium]|jgi:DNA-binding transcriptional LysR family regulator
MDFRQLESFVTIVKYNSFTRAAEELFLTQPTLTAHIQSLEKELGTILFDRCGKMITLTEAGQIMYNHAVNILNMKEQAFYSLARYEGHLEGVLSIASSTVPQKYLLPGLLTDFSCQYPYITYNLRQFDSSGVLDAIISGSMDFGFVGSSTAYPELEMLKLCDDQLLLIAANKGKFASYRQHTVLWEQVKDEKFILRPEGSATGKLFINGLREKGIDIKDLHVIAHIEDPDTIKRCVRAGLGVAVVSEKSVEEEIELGLLKGFYIADMELRRGFYFIKHKKRVLNPVARAFQEFIEGSIYNK